MISANGSNIYAEKNVELTSLITEKKVIKNQKSLWGLNKTHHKKNHQGAVPTLIYDQGNIRIHANTESILSRGTLFLGDGDLSLWAAKDITLSRDILNHSLETKTQTITPSLFGLNAYRLLQDGGTPWKALTREDPLLAKIDDLIHSHGASSWIANSSNAGIAAFNTLNNLFQGSNNGGLAVALRERFGLGGIRGLDPTIGFSFNQTGTRQNYQTTGPGGGIERKHIDLQAGQTIHLQNGFKIHGTENVTMAAEKIKMTAAELSMHTETSSKTLNLGATASGSFVDVGFGLSKSKTKGKNFENTELVARNLHLQTNEFEMKGANITTESISGNVNQTRIESLQDTFKSSSSGLHLSKSGALSFFRDRLKIARINKTSGIHTKNGINDSEKTFRINEAKLEAAAITSDASIHEFTDNITTKKIQDYEKSQGFGISANLSDLTRLNNQPLNPQGHSRPAISTAAVNYSKTDFKAFHRGTIHGKRGTNLEQSLLRGKLNTTDTSGYKVQRDEKQTLHLEVPITNQDSLKQAASNIRETLKCLSSPNMNPPPSSLQPSRILEEDLLLDQDMPALIDESPPSTQPNSFRNGISEALQLIGRGMIESELLNPDAPLPTVNPELRKKIESLKDKTTALIQSEFNSVSTKRHNEKSIKYAPENMQLNAEIEVGSKWQYKKFQSREFILGASIDTETEVLSAEALAKGDLHIGTHGVKADVSGTAGVKLLNVHQTFESPYLHLGGWKFEYANTFEMGLGVGVSASAGISLTEQGLKLSSKGGLYSGLGVENDATAGIGIDPEYQNEIRRLIDGNKSFIKELNRSIHEVDNKTHPSFWDHYNRSCWTECLDNKHELIYDVARSSLRITERKT